MPVHLVYNGKFGRKIRMDDPDSIGIPTQNLIEKALQNGKTEDALELLQYLGVEFKILKDSVLGGWLSDLIEFMLEKRGCEDLKTVLRVPAATIWESMYQSGIRIQMQTFAAIEAGENEKAVILLESIRQIYKLINDLVVRWVQDILTYVSGRFGEEEVKNAMRVSYDRIWVKRYADWETYTPEEQLALSAEGMRAHYGGPTRRGEFRVTDEGDRYAMFFDPCGTGGVMRRGDPETGEGPWDTAGVSRQPHHWTFQKTDVPYYCAHCTLYLEYFAAMDYGYPIRPMGFDPDHHAPCRWYIYKSKDKIREEHYAYLGLQKEHEK